MVTTAVGSAGEALERMRDAVEHGQPFPLVVTDIHMPEMDGFELAGRIKESPQLANAVIMMLTSAEQRGDFERCLTLGISSHLLKPVRQGELRAAVIRALAAPVAGEAGLRVAGHVGPSSVAIGPDGPPARILLAEDHEVNRRLAERILKKGGHHVVAAVTGREAFAAWEDQPFDVILMDVQMPDMDGFETTAKIRAAEQNADRHVTIIAMTAHAMTGDRERCLAAGMDGYLAKPVRAADLLGLIRVAMKNPVMP
jgi:CheY-like chemotaxis protein